MEIIYDENLCVRCGACATECECGGIYFERGRLVIDETRAEDWASIAEICPTGAIKIRKRIGANVAPEWNARA